MEVFIKEKDGESMVMNNMPKSFHTLFCTNKYRKTHFFIYLKVKALNGRSLKFEVMDVHNTNSRAKLYFSFWKTLIFKP